MHTTNNYTYNKFRTYGNCLYTSPNDLTQDDIQSLITYLNNHINITSIKLEDNDGSTCIPLLAAIQAAPHVVTLDCRKCNLTKCEEAIPKIFNLIFTNKFIQHLHLDINLIDAKSTEIIAEHLQKNCSLQSLSLNENSIGDAGVTLISNAINSNDKCALTSLTLQANSISCAGLKILAAMMQSNTSITRLDVLFNGINDSQNIHWSSIIENEVTKNTLGDQSKLKTITNTKKRLDTLQRILLDSEFQKKTGHRQGLIEINKCLSSCDPILEKWDKLKNITASRKGTLSTYMFLTFGGRDELTQKIYDIIENDSFDELNQLSNSYDVLKSFYFI